MPLLRSSTSSAGAAASRWAWNAAGGEHFTAVQKEARELGRKRGRPGYRVHSQIEDAWELGVPQKRQRQLIIGVRNDLPGYFLPELRPAPRAEPRT